MKMKIPISSIVKGTVFAGVVYAIVAGINAAIGIFPAGTEVVFALAAFAVPIAEGLEKSES